MITRRFEYTGGGSDKFWEVTYPDWSVDRGVRTWTCRWGRRGANGQEKTFTEATQGQAMIAAGDKIDEKLRKGYVEITRRATVPAAPAVQTVPYTSPRMRPRSRPDANSSDAHEIVKAALELSRTTGIDLPTAIDAIKQAAQIQVNPANFSAALAAATKAAQPSPHAPRTRKITLE